MELRLGFEPLNDYLKYELYKGAMKLVQDVMLAKRKVSVTELSERLGITMANVSILKNGKAKAVKLETLNKICKILDCQPGDILEYVPDPEKEG